jgi:hypothetical protein
MTPSFTSLRAPKGRVAISTESVIARLRLFSCHCEPAEGRRGNLLFLTTKRLLRFARNDKIRDCFVASLLAMTRFGDCFAFASLRLAMTH